MNESRLDNALDYCKRLTKKRKDKARCHIIYILKCGEYYKIGYASDLAKRLCDYKVHNPAPMTVIRFAATPMHLQYERWIRIRFQSKHHHGEWYRFDDADLLRIDNRWFIV